MSFSDALVYLLKGKRVKRKGWNGKNQFIEIGSNVSYIDPNGNVVNINHETMGNKCIVFHGTTGTQCGWLASQADLLSTDWYVVE